MRRFFLNEAANTSWVKQQKATKTDNKRVVYILTKFNGEEVIYDDFWDAVIDAEDKYCMDANMIDGYFVTTDEDGINSYELVYKSNDNAPYDGHWTEEEGTLTEPSMNYEDYVTSTGLTEAGQFPFEIPQMTNWVSRAPVTKQAATTPTALPPVQKQATPTQSQTASPQQAKLPGKFQVKPLASYEIAALNNFSGDRVAYALVLGRIFMDRLAPKFGLDLTDPSVKDFYDSIHDLCTDVEDNEAWPTLAECEAHFVQMVGRTMTKYEQAFMRNCLAVLDELAPYGVCEIFLNSSHFYELMADNWLDSECDYDDYDYAFTLGWNGKPEDDWTDMIGFYNHGGEYLECAYETGNDSRAWFNKVCGI